MYCRLVVYVIYLRGMERVSEEDLHCLDVDTVVATNIILHFKNKNIVTLRSSFLCILGRGVLSFIPEYQLGRDKGSINDVGNNRVMFIIYPDDFFVEILRKIFDFLKCDFKMCFSYDCVCFFATRIRINNFLWIRAAKKVRIRIQMILIVDI